ncbi:fatty acid desaturase [bacterium]|nr:fatty acid desaturase [bacterium]
MSSRLESLTNEQAADEHRPRPVAWYRTPVDPQVLKGLHQRSDFRGALQTVGYLGTLVATGCLAFYSAGRWPWWVTVLLVFLHGTCFAFQINAVHELGHGTVFHTRWLNGLFERVFAFLGWINFLMFDTSHVRHHQYTLHPPDDLEVVLPIRLLVKHMNYHTEHHMYAAVPCYRLGQLHRLIEHDLPPCPRGIIATWNAIAAIQRAQDTDPSYQHAAPCPNPRPKDADRRETAGISP